MYIRQGRNTKDLGLDSDLHDTSIKCQTEFSVYSLIG